MSDYYKILGIDKKATLSDIKKAYRKLARKYHPDLNPGDKTAEARFKEITEAYEVLRDSDKRKQYDTFGTVGNQNFNGGGRSGFDGFDFNTTGSNSFGDIFETIFGGGFSGGGAQRRSTATGRKPVPGEDLRYSMTLSFVDAANGIETPIQVVRKIACAPCKGKGVDPESSKVKCIACNGTGRVQKQTGFMKFASPCPECNGTGVTPGMSCSECRGEGRTDKVSKIKVRIPAGVDDKSKVRIGGRGNSGKYGGSTGDLIITINVTPHQFFKREGLDLYVNLPVTYSEAALGAKVEVPTLNGTTLVKIPPGTASGKKLRIRGKGIANPKSGQQGDMFIEIRIIPPSIKDLEVRKLLQKIDKKAPYNPREGIYER